MHRSHLFCHFQNALQKILTIVSPEDVKIQIYLKKTADLLNQESPLLFSAYVSKHLTAKDWTQSLNLSFLSQFCL